jgi:acyl-CoA reductase-like NAD-dependent aldehyde dehydrogenase
MSKYSLFIGGKPVVTEKSFNVLNPADESIVAACPEASPAQVDAAVAAARKAQPAWAALPEAERVAKLHAIADLIKANGKELSELLTREQGKTQSGLGANLEVGGAEAWTRVTASLSLPVETIEDDKSKILVLRKPVGVVASITPWNWPLMIAVWHIMPALRAGCTVINKPASFTPLATLRLIELMNQVLPPGVMNSLAGGGGIGAQLAAHPDVNKVVFTGSIPTGQKIMSGAVATLKRLTLELGGNDAGIVLPGTKIDPLLEKLFWGCFINAGQTCSCLKRLYVHADQYEEVVSKFADFVAKIPVGNGLDPKNLIGPVSNKPQLNLVSELVDEARARGARIVTGGVRPKGPGYFYPLTVIADVTDDMGIVKDEQFGPAIPIIKYHTIEEALQRANALDVGLGGSVWGNDPEEAARYAQQLECGTAWVNQHAVLHPMAPMGGVKMSGIGLEFNVDGLREYTTVQVLSVAR